METNFLITGHPRVGKTTLVKKLVAWFGHLALTGFYTEEIIERDRRVGFRAVALNGSSVVFAHRDFRTDAHRRVGRYGVRPDVLETLALPHLDPHRKRADLVIVDEIGKMELLSSRFRESMIRALDSEYPVLATIARKGTGIIKKIKARRDVALFELTRRNRDVLGGEISRRVHRALDAPVRPISVGPERGG